MAEHKRVARDAHSYSRWRRSWRVALVVQLAVALSWFACTLWISSRPFLELEDTAEILDISPATVKREWSTARAWLNRELQP